MTFHFSIFPGVICKISQDSIIDGNSSVKGSDHIRSVPSAATVKNEAMIQRTWDELAEGTISPKRLVDRLKYRVGGCKQSFGRSQLVPMNSLSSILTSFPPDTLPSIQVCNVAVYSLTPT